MDKLGAGKLQQVGSSSSSSFTVDLFGPKDQSTSKSSTDGLFGSIFASPPTSMAPAGREPRRPDFGRAYIYANVDKHEYHTDCKNKKAGNPIKKDKNPKYENEINPSAAEPNCYFNSSIYYGGQEVYSPTTCKNNNNNNSPPHNFKKDGRDVDPSDQGNSNCASRGNWWQGSLYY